MRGFDLSAQDQSCQEWDQHDINGRDKTGVPDGSSLQPDLLAVAADDHHQSGQHGIFPGRALRRQPELCEDQQHKRRGNVAHAVEGQRSGGLGGGLLE